MPLPRGKENVGRNVKELEKSGRPQAVALALKTAGPSKYALPGGCNTSPPAPAAEKKHRFDESEFERIEAVPIFDEHPGAEEDVDIDFTPEVLQRIVDRCNQRISETEDYPVVTDGHTEEGQPDPPVLGFAVNFRMGEIGKARPRKCIYCDLMIRKDKMERAKALPRRSIELWHQDLAPDNVVLEPKRLPIDTISLLGATRPARDLGLMFRKKAGAKSRYDLTRTNMALDQNDMQQLLEAVMQLPALQWCEGQMSKAEPAKAEYEEDKKPDEEKPEGPAEGPPAKEAKFEEVEKDDDHEDEGEVGKEKLRMQRDQQKRRYAKLETEYKSLFAKVAELERKERRADRQAKLMQLEAEGYVFDLAEELEGVQDYEPARFSKHVALIKKNYKKAPVGVRLSPIAMPEEGGSVTPAAKTPHEVMLEASKRAQEIYARSK